MERRARLQEFKQFHFGSFQRRGHLTPKILTGLVSTRITCRPPHGGFGLLNAKDTDAEQRSANLLSQIVGQPPPKLTLVKNFQQQLDESVLFHNILQTRGHLTPYLTQKKTAQKVPPPRGPSDNCKNYLATANFANLRNAARPFESSSR